MLISELAPKLMRTAFWARSLTIVLLGLVTASLALAQPPDSNWSLRSPLDEPVSFSGRVNHDSAGVNGGNILYPAPSFAGLLVAVVTHGVIVESQKEEKKRALQTDADRVLDPLRVSLEGFRHRELFQRAMSRLNGQGTRVLVDSQQPISAGWVVDSTPTFALTQDQTALVLDNIVSISLADKPEDPVQRLTVRVISTPKTALDPVAFWSATSGAALREESAALVAHSLGLAFQEIALSEPVKAAQPFKTVRYPEGNAERMERAQLVRQICNRQILRNLRGWIFSVPARKLAADVAPECDPTSLELNP